MAPLAQVIVTEPGVASKSPVCLASLNPFLVGHPASAALSLQFRGVREMATQSRAAGREPQSPSAAPEEGVRGPLSDVGGGARGCYSWGWGWPGTRQTIH